MGKRIRAWHFLAEDYRLQFGSRRKMAAGDRLTVKGRPVLCKHGLHASRRIIDALTYAPGPICCRVLIGGTIAEATNKMAGTTREIEWTLDATDVLHRFACQCAKTALTKANVADKRCWSAIHTKLRWLDGLATDEELVAAREAASDAASDAAGIAAWIAAGDAAWVAARDAAWVAASDAGWDAAWVAAGDAARVAAGDAARIAAIDAASDAQNYVLEDMLNAIPFE